MKKQPQLPWLKTQTPQQSRPPSLPHLPPWNPLSFPRAMTSLRSKMQRSPCGPSLSTLQRDGPHGDLCIFDRSEDAEVPVWAIPVNAAEGITEDQARAGADFAD